ncbi:MAG: FHIPEP family type III secretion protein [Deltaproteobacteria bacterium]|nr:FHIPEP family type III secretion protein [Deltaproteobacteria bacterium]
MKKLPDGERAAPTVPQEIEALAKRLLTCDTGEEPYRQFISALSDRVVATTRQAESYVSVTELLEIHKRQVARLLSTLDDMVLALGKLAEARARREKYTERWWEQVHQELNSTLASDQEAAFQRWVELYAQALLDWRLDICHRLASTPLPFPPRLSPYMILFRFGTEAVQAGDYQRSLQMLNYLAEIGLASSPADGAKLMRAQLYIFIGRIHLYRDAYPAAAKSQFEIASELVPRDGRPFAALGHCSLLQSNQEGKSEAERLFSKAVELSPDQPDGYVGMGLLAEGRELWGEVDDWYRHAVEVVLDEPDLLTSLGKLLSPGSGRLYLEAARRLLQDEKVQQALAAIGKAFELGVIDGTKYPERAVYALKGRILEQLYRESETAEGLNGAAQAYFKAGQEYYWQNEITPAVELFKRAKLLNSERVETFWYLADALRLQSSKPEPPYVDERLINESLDVWNQVANRLPTDDDSSWAYMARSSISELLSRVPSENSDERLWEALVYVERAMLYYADAYRQAELGRCYRCLSLDANALHATQLSLELNPSDSRVMEERAASLINVGEYESADELLQKLISQSSPELQAFYKGWQGLVRYFQGRYSEGLDCINARLEHYKDEIWSWGVRAQLHRMNGDLEKFQQDCNWIWQQRDKSAHKGEALTIAWSGYWLNLADEAVEIAQLALKKRGNTQEVALLTGLCRLLQGQIPQADEYLTRALELVTNRNQVDFMEMEVGYLEKRAADGDWPELAKLLSGLAFISQQGGVKDKISVKRQNLAEAKRLPVAELESIIAEDDFSRPGSWRWLAAQAGLGRLYLEGKRWQKAADAYQQLREYAADFAEAPKGLERLRSALVEEGKQHLKAGEYARAIEEFEESLNYQAVASDRTEVGDTHGLMGSAFIGLEDTMQARHSFAQAVQLYREDNIPDPAEHLGVIVSESVSNMTHYWALDSTWQSWGHDPEKVTAVSPDYTAARQGLRQYLNRVFELQGGAEMVPAVTPIAVEIGRGLIPEETGENWPLIKTYLPEMRDRIEHQTGVRVPGVRIRGNETDLPAGSYVIMIDEIPLVMGSAGTDTRYCPASSEALRSLGIAKEDFSEGAHPLTNEPGCWVAAQHWNLVTSKGIELWTDPLIYMVYHLEGVLRRNLVDFLGVQEVENLLESWEKLETGASLIRTALPDDVSRVRFARVLRAIVKERVPITDWKAILEAVGEVGLAHNDASEAVRAIRIRLKSLLSGNSRGDVRVELPREVEDKMVPWLWHDAGKTFFALPPEETQEILGDVRKLIDTSRKNLVLVVQSSELRPFVRRLVEIEFPDLMVIAEKELIAVADPVGQAVEKPLNEHTLDRSKC